MRNTLKCDVCQHNKEDVIPCRAKYGKNKVYFACPNCREEMAKTSRLLDASHKKAVLSGKFKLTSGTFALSPLNTYS